MRWTFGRPQKGRVLRLLIGGGVLISLTVAICVILRWPVALDKELGPAAKYIGLILASALGLVGTATDTKEARNGGYHMRPMGWAVVAGITAALGVGAYGQYYEDRQKQEAESKQKEALENVAAVATHSVERYSGRLTAAVEIVFPINQDPLADIARDYQIEHPTTPYGFDDFQHDPIAERFRKRFGQIQCKLMLSVAQPPHVTHTSKLLELTLKVLRSDDVKLIRIDNHSVTAILFMKPVAVLNYGIYSAGDFVHRRVRLTYDGFIGTVRDGLTQTSGYLHGGVWRFTLSDSDLQTVLARADLTPMASTSSRDEETFLRDYSQWPVVGAAPRTTVADAALSVLRPLRMPRWHHSAFHALQRERQRTIALSALKPRARFRIVCCRGVGLS